MSSVYVLPSAIPFCRGEEETSNVKTTETTVLYVEVKGCSRNNITHKMRAQG